MLRMKPGEEMAVSNGTDGKEYRCGIEEILEDEVVCSLRFVKRMTGTACPRDLFSGAAEKRTR